MAWTSNYLRTSVLLAAVIPAWSQEPAEMPVLVIESFRPARAYVADMNAFTLASTIRNVGKSPLPADSARGRLISLAGLDLTGGDTLPKLPELASGAAVSYKWQVTPSRPDGPLAASFTISAPGQPVIVRALSIPRLESPPPPESSNAAKVPTAVSESGITTLENDRIRVRIVNDISRDPILLFSIRTSGGWRQAGASVPLVEVQSAEPGQRSWWEQLNVEEARVTQSPADAAIHLTGKIGLKWQVELELKLRAGSGALDAEVIFAALRPVRTSGIRVLPLLAGEGSFGAASTETLESTPGGPAVHRAVRWGEITVGTVRRAASPFVDWQAVNVPIPEGTDYRLLATEWIPGPDLVNVGQIIRLKSRIFALAPSVSVREAYSVAPPESVTQNRADSRL